ncbi:hypothetical protein J3F83DRAFT_523487 [Trichoderma novae-zelandiae]
MIDDPYRTSLAPQSHSQPGALPLSVQPDHIMLNVQCDSYLGARATTRTQCQPISLTPPPRRLRCCLVLVTEPTLAKEDRRGEAKGADCRTPRNDERSPIRTQPDLVTSYMYPLITVVYRNGVRDGVRIEGPEEEAVGLFRGVVPFRRTLAPPRRRKSPHCIALHAQQLRVLRRIAGLFPWKVWRGDNRIAIDDSPLLRTSERWLLATTAVTACPCAKCGGI